MRDTTADEQTDERWIDYEYRSEAPAVPDVGTPGRTDDGITVVGTPELQETAEPGWFYEDDGRLVPLGRRREAGR